MNEQTSKSSALVWKETPWVWLSFITLAAFLAYGFYAGLKELLHVWETQEEYSYGYMIPFITLFLIWQRKDILERIPFPGSWWGVTLVLFGVALLGIGIQSSYYHVIQYAFLVVLAGLAISFTGKQGFMVILVPLLFLFFMIPLPGFILSGLSTQLQMLSSQLGVAVIRAFGISVFLEGNVIDLGVMKLQVVEACSGLRYLFPLMTLAFIAAYFFKGGLFKRSLIFLSSIPITVLLNSFRIGMIGITVEYWGRGMAEGFLHDFEGWAVFMGCTAILVAEVWLLARIGSTRMLFREAFCLEFPTPTPKDAEIRYRTLPKTYVTAMLLVVASTLAYGFMPERHELQPARKSFSEFPLEVGGWKGKKDSLEQIYKDQLRLDDYVISNFVDVNQHAVNFYVAYYASQNKGAAVHSPRDCLPGGGWRILNLTQHPVGDLSVRGKPLIVNRAVIQMGDSRQLTYFWYQMAGRIITNDYLERWFIFWDTLTRNRSDGALVRLITPLATGESEESGDARLVEFSRLVVPRLPEFVPD